MQTWCILTILALTTRNVYARRHQMNRLCYLQNTFPKNRNYLPFDLENFDPKLCTHMVYASANFLKNGTVQSTHPYYDEKPGLDGLSKFTALKKKNPNTTFIISITGESGPQNFFTNMLSTEKSRTEFVKSAISFAKLYKFDGIEISWYSMDISTINVTTIKGQFSSLIVELGKKCIANNLVLTAMLSPYPQIVDTLYNLPDMNEYFDFVTVRTLDYHTELDGVTGFNAPLFERYSLDYTIDCKNIKCSIDVWMARGFPSEKIYIALAAYGQVFFLLDESDPTVGSLTFMPGTSRTTWSYGEICDRLRRHWTKVWDEEQRVPYMYRCHQWVGFDNIKSLTEKIFYAQKLKLGGVSLWSVDMDDLTGACGFGTFALTRLIYILL